MAPAVTEAEKSRHLPFASWRPNKTSGVIQSEFKGLRSRQGCWRLRTGGDGWPSSSKKKRKKKQIPLSLLFVFCLSPQRIGGHPLALVRVTSFTQSTHSAANVFWAHSWAHPEIRSDLLSGHPLAPSSWLVKLSHEGSAFLDVGAVLSNSRSFNWPKYDRKCLSTNSSRGVLWTYFEVVVTRLGF